MSRNGSGTMSIVNTLVSGEVIEASDHNENYSDIASEITNSVAVDGQSTMTGPLKAASGTVAAPGMTFGADTDSGLYRIGSNNIGAAVGGTKILDVSSTGLDVIGAVKQNGLTLLPIGLGPLPWTDTTAPSGWVFAGATYSRTTYAALWSFAQTAIANGSSFFTNGDGSTTFTIASMDGRGVVGVDTGGTVLGSVTTIGAATGSKSVTLADNQIPSLTSTNGSQSITTTVPSSKKLPMMPAASTLSTNAAGSSGGGGFGYPYINGTLYTWEELTSWSTSNSISVAYTNGSQQVTSIVQPVRAAKFIFFAGV